MRSAIQLLFGTYIAAQSLKEINDEIKRTEAQLSALENLKIYSEHHQKSSLTHQDVEIVAKLAHEAKKNKKIQRAPLPTEKTAEIAKFS